MGVGGHARWRRPGDGGGATSGVPDCSRVLPRGGRFCCGRLVPGVLASKAAAWLTGFLAGWLGGSHCLPGCACWE